ncbi:hypothetical protein GCM10023196_070000 [Actinoallomurus vinaceus]|uniref:Uncharacterized protein n=1 Tax=Actinoallomurus vinaceus TaxID=1080074 RepID=A0ABP8UJZ5_9ACTN
MMNVWVKTRRDGLVRAADILRIQGDGRSVRVWHRAASDTTPSSVAVCEVPRRTPKLPGDFAEQLALVIAQYQKDFALVEAVRQPSGWGWMITDALAVRPQYYCPTPIPPSAGEPFGSEPSAGPVETPGLGRFLPDNER